MSFNKNEWLQLYRTMCLSVALDLREQMASKAGEVQFCLLMRGHEGAAVPGMLLKQQDWIHGHYRSRAMTLARGVSVEEWMHILYANDQSMTQGRQMPYFMDCPERHIAPGVIPVGNNGLQAVGIALELRDQGLAATPEISDGAVVLCGVGDGTTQQGEMLEAFAHASREKLPVLFWVEDNGYAISTPTAGKAPLELTTQQELFGVPVIDMDGTQPQELVDDVAGALEQVRSGNGPVICRVRMARLESHSAADDQSIYKDADAYQQEVDTKDPVLNLRQWILTQEVATEQELETIQQEAAAEVEAAAQAARLVGDPIPALQAKIDLPEHLQPKGSRPDAPLAPQADGLTMGQALQATLDHSLSTLPRLCLTGQDIEDPKGDVFGVTRGLSTKYGSRVTNAPLAESTIVGTTIGRSLVGGTPAAFIQFADFLPTGIGQLLTEAGSMWWRTVGRFQSHVTFMMAGGGYRPGLGPFHAQTLDGLLAHVPGLDVLMPSNATDAAGLLAASLQSPRPTILVYPKALLNDRSSWSIASPDVIGSVLPIGRARCMHEGDQVTLVTWGASVIPCRAVVADLAAQGVQVDLLDLRSIQPWDQEAVIASVRKTGHLLVVHEDSHSGGFGAEIVATVSEVCPEISVARCTRPDTWIPYNFPNHIQILPGYTRVFEALAQLIGLEYSWQKETKAEADAATSSARTITAQGPSPADESVTVIRWMIAEGDTIAEGQPIADMEADKAAFEMSAPASGVVLALHADEGDKLDVGEPLMAIQEAAGSEAAPYATRRPTRDVHQPFVVHGVANTVSQAAQHDVFVSAPAVEEGAEVLDNASLVKRFGKEQDMDADGIVQRTGIHTRPMMAETQTVLTMAVAAAQAVLEREGVSPSELGGVVVHTTTPLEISPSLSCQILAGLGKDLSMPAVDILAACSGWLYGLHTAADYAHKAPGKPVLMVTAEGLSRVVDAEDFDTAILFGDAATASLVVAGEQGYRPRTGMRLASIALDAKADPSRALTVGLGAGGGVVMDGKRVFSEATRSMVQVTKQVCDEARIEISSLDWLVPHQANGRIMEAVRARLQIDPSKVINEVRHCGNTSSSSIPLALSHHWQNLSAGERVGACAFGAGFTYAAALFEVL